MGGFMGIGFVLDEEGNIIAFNDPEKIYSKV